MNILGVKVEYKEIKEIYTDIRGYFNSVDLEICIALRIANENVSQWYDDINNFATNMVDRESRVTYAQFFNFTHKRERSEVSEALATFLRGPKFKHYKSGIFKLKERDLSSDSGSIGDLISTFKDQGIIWKKEVLQHAGDNDLIDVPRDEVNLWVSRLYSLREEINNVVTMFEQNQDLPCHRMQNSYKEAFEEAIRKVRDKHKHDNQASL